jgi:Phosphodiester glycosidase
MTFTRRRVAVAVAGVALVLVATPPPVAVAGGAGSRPAPVCVAGATTGAPPVCTPWRARDTWAGASAPVYTTTFAPNRAQPQVLAHAAWIRSSSTDLALYLGYKGPGPTSLPRGPEMVPPQVRSRLLATFNSGFYEMDAAEGFYVNHTLYFPMIDGQATVERLTNGRVDIVRWTGGPRPAGNVVMARQNMPLLVNAGRPTPLSADNAAWGSTLGGVPAVWRSALCVDAQGNLTYAAAPDQTSASLAAVMVQLHCVRAMQLDINPEWPIFVVYGGPGAASPAMAVANPNQIPTRFLYVSTKDFFAVYLSRRPGEPQPW